MTTVHRIFNFSAGPAVLPLPVLEEAREHLLALPGVGMSILEISHRSKPFEEICYGAEADLRKLAGVPDGYQVLFLQGGATLQFSMVPMNLLPAGGTADYIETGVWSEKAIAEAKKLGSVHVAATLEGDQPRPHPGTDAEIALQREPGLRPHDHEQHDLRHPVAPRARRSRRACRWSTTPRPTSSAGRSTSRSYGLIYAGAQKNLSIAGLTLVDHPRGPARQGAREPRRRSTSTTPTHAKERSLYNTPPVFGIYILHLVLSAGCSTKGGLAAMAERNRRKAGEALRGDRRLAAASTAATPSPRAAPG